jgi:hypothetical protein
MPATSSNLVQILRLNRGPTTTVAAELAPYIGTAHFAGRIRAMLSGDIRRYVREAVGEDPWQFGIVEGPWFSGQSEALHDLNQGEQVFEAGMDLFHRWLTGEPDGSLMSDELNKTMIAAIERIEKLPIPTVHAQTDFEERYISHSRTTPLLGLRPLVTESSVHSPSQPTAPISSAPLVANDTLNDATNESASFEDMILAAREASAPNAQYPGHDEPDSMALVPPANDTNRASLTPTYEIPQQVMPLTGLPPFPFFDMSTLEEAC